MKIFIIILSLFWLIACSESANHSKNNRCSNECSVIGTYCKDNSVVQCYEDETKCLKEQILVECSVDEICNSNVCLKSNCENECLETETECNDNRNEIKICGNFDEDICFEWQTISCPQNHICENNICIYENCTDNETIYCGSDIGECQKGIQTCNNGIWSECVGEVKPIAEICDGIDNNCDGTTDEVCFCSNGETKECGSDIGSCRKGEQTCNNGVWSNCQGDVKPTEEVCNGLDDNCDNSVDNIINPPEADKHFGVCIASVKICNGTEFIEPDYTLLPNYEETETLCDNLDNDCNNVIDNLIQTCYSGPTETNNVGICLSGSQSCLSGNWGNCEGEILPAEELCDNSDNDCDGITDGMTESCYTGQEGTNGVGECKNGIKTCDSGIFGVCVGEVIPTTEICDGKDNDCDYSSDEMIHLEGATCKNDNPPVAGSKSALKLSGGREFVKTANTIDLRNSSFTVELWIKVADSQKDPAIVSNKDWNDGKNKGFIIALIDDGKWKYNIGDGDDARRIDCDGERVADNNWHHIAGVYDSGNKKVILYQDGVKVCESQNSNIRNDKIADNVKIWIGQHKFEWYSPYFDGTVDEVRIWKKIKTQDEIKAEMFKHLKGNESNLSLYYKFDQQNGTTVKDSSVNNNNGTIVNDAEYVVSEAFKNRIAILNTPIIIYTGYDPQNKQLITTIANACINGITNIDNINQTITYLPNNNYLGADTFSYQLANFDLTDSSTINIDVIPPYCSDCTNNINCFVCYIRHNGGYGGNNNQLTQCPENHVVAGITTTQTSYDGSQTLNYINLICKEKQGNVLIGNEIFGGEFGSAGTIEPIPLKCNDATHPNGVMVGELIWLTPNGNDYVKNVGLVCNTLENIANGNYSDTYNIIPTGEVNPSVSKCRDGYIVSGYKVKNGAVIDSINFLCKE